jgi:transglutaminase-like putative cysteine protease
MASLAQTRENPVSTTVDRYLQWCLYLMLVTGFGALATTGQLDLPSVALVLAALLLRGYSLVRGMNTSLTETTVRWLSLAYGGFYFLDLYLVSGHFMSATVHLVLFGMVLRLFSAHRTRDHLFLAMLAFAMVLAAAVLTVAGTFLFTFAIFLLMAVVTFILMEMSRGQTSASIASGPGDAGVMQKQLPWTLAGTGAALLVIILLCAAGIFFVLPRVSSGYFNSLQVGNDISTGFGTDVRLGRIGEIQQSSAVVMHVKVDGDTSGARELRLRGVTLGTFDGHTWSNRLGQFVLSRSSAGDFVLSPRSEIAGDTRKTFRYHVFAEPSGTSVFFLAEHPLTLAGNYRMVATDSSAAAFNMDREHQVSAYDGTSLSDDRFEKAARRPVPALPPPMASVYLALPDLDPRIPLLARDITAAATSDEERTSAVEGYLSRTYAYTLQLPQTEPRDPLANFLFERKRGHCEYFAASMTVLLRTLGIPARLVNGFHGGEFNDVSGEYIIRAREAHSWVEAYIAGRGWVSYDPTPAAGALSPRTGWGRLALYVDALSSFWREWVINYDATHQRTLGEETLRNTRTIAQTWRERLRAPYLRLVAAARHARNLAVQSPRRWILGALAAVMLLLAAMVAGRLPGWFRRRHLAAHPEEAPRTGASLWYVRLLRRLSRDGWKKVPAQTPEEFAASIADPSLRRHVARFTKHYEKARFGDSAPDAEKLPQLFEEISESRR